MESNSSFTKGVKNLLTGVPNTKTRKNIYTITYSEILRVNLGIVAERLLPGHQQLFSINVRAGNVGDFLTGRHISSHRFTGNHYRDFLLHDLSELLENVQLAIKSQLWYMHDGAPPHFSLSVWDALNNTSHDRWIGTGGPTAWLSHSPGLNPLDFYLWDT
jgi:hypothetical protein